MRWIIRLLVDRMLDRVHGALFALICLLVPCAALSAGFNQGDLLVTDNGGSRVLRVNATNGAVSLFSPPSGGTNLLNFPAGIAIAADGTVYIASNGSNKVIQIEPQTGVQTALPFAVGQHPWGLDMDAAGNLFVLAQTAGDVWKITAPAGPSGFSSKVVTDSLLIDAWGLSVQGNGTLRMGGDTSGLLSVDPSLVTPSVSIVEPPEEAVMKVVGVSRLESTTQFGVSGGTVCSGRLAGVWYHWTPSWQKAAANALDGTGPFHCVFSLALTPDNQTYYVGDAGSFLGGSAQILKIEWSTGNVTTLASIPDATGFALPAGIAVAPITVPEPDASVSLIAALAALWMLGKFRRPLEAYVG